AAIIITGLCLHLGGCVTTKEPSSNIAKDIWTGEMTGMAKAKLHLESFQTSGSDSDTLIQGRIKMNIESAQGVGGNITLLGELTGRIKDGLMKAKISGDAKGAKCTGDFIGTMSETQGFGTWEITAIEEVVHLFEGEWHLVKK
ncbi:MAG: hypothetical protein MI892_26110, partial [Desulfobacterales bacterium]|nr:hypothetical protein [Desulfobacterales bacterium]